MSRRAGFTLFELCLAIIIAVLLVTMAAPSVSGLLSERRAKKTFDALDDLVRDAQTRSITERRAFVIEWERDRIFMRPEQPANKDEASGLAQIAIEKGSQFELELPAALTKKPAPIWTFWPTGTCEPAVIRYEGETGKWTARYDPLTVRAVLEL